MQNSVVFLCYCHINIDTVCLCKCVVKMKAFVLDQSRFISEAKEDSGMCFAKPEEFVSRRHSSRKRGVCCVADMKKLFVQCIQKPVNGASCQEVHDYLNLA